MTDRDEDGTSFDPRSWSGEPAAPAETPKPAIAKPDKAKRARGKPPKVEVAKTKDTPPPPITPADVPVPKPDSTSFDPRAWTGAQATASESRPDTAIDRDPTSFDPKAWGQDGAPPLPPAGAATSRRGLVIGGIAVILGGGGVAAWLSRPAKPDPATPAATATIAPPPPDAPPEPASRRTLSVEGSAAILPTLAAAGVPAAPAAAVASAAVGAIGAGPGEVRLVFDLIGEEGKIRVTRLEATRDDGSGAILTARAEGGFATEKLAARLKTEMRTVRGEMDANSFYSSAVAAGITDTLIDPFANAFSFDFNFATDIVAGDVFEATFEQKYNPTGAAVGAPNLVYVAMTTAEKSRKLYRFLAPGETEAGWFDGNGASTVRALMRTPVDGARISSPFGMRFHPVLHFNKLHKGTDFAAPTGTPIYAAGTGVIIWAAMKGPNGNLTILQHDNGWQTYYLHQSRYEEGIAAGVRVNQGQRIGYIGTTGRSTGPHLHFELHIDGEPVDPMGVDTGTAKVLDGGALAAFRKERDRIDASRAAEV